MGHAAAKLLDNLKATCVMRQKHKYEENRQVITSRRNLKMDNDDCSIVGYQDDKEKTQIIERYY